MKPALGVVEGGASTAAAIAIEAAGLAHRYGGGRGLPPVSFAAAAPGVVAVTGPNGSGKSTLLRLLAGLLRPTAGSVQVALGGRPLDDAGRRRHIGYAAPDLSFYEELSVIENLSFAAEALGLRDPQGAIRASLEHARITAFGRERVAALSSGMKQRVRIAFALLREPALLLLDEPGSHLDAAGREAVETLVRMHARRGLVLIATNDEREWKLADQRIELGSRGLGDLS